MPETNGKPADFPDAESFEDCCGTERHFDLNLLVTDGGYFLRAQERTDNDGGYHAAAHSESSPYLALGRLRDKIRLYLSQRYLITENGRRGFRHLTAEGYVDYGGVVIDGEFLAFDEFSDILQSYEGWEFTLKIRSGFEERS